jgi:hypothetical protein
MKIEPQTIPETVAIKRKTMDSETSKPEMDKKLIKTETAGAMSTTAVKTEDVKQETGAKRPRRPVIKQSSSEPEFKLTPEKLAAIERHKAKK